MPHACTFTRTSCGPGSGMSRVTISKPPPGLLICAAIIFTVSGVWMLPRERGHLLLKLSDADISGIRENRCGFTHETAAFDGRAALTNVPSA